VERPVQSLLTFCRVDTTVLAPVPLKEGNLAQNIRRLAGMHLASMDKLAQYIEISRQTMQAIVAHDPAQRSLPRAETTIKLAEAFGVSLDALYSEPAQCLREAVEHFEQAPIRQTVEAPSVLLERQQVKDLLEGRGLVTLSTVKIPEGEKRIPQPKKSRK
jgi:DNA-binding XRE family transcriptional regulator